MCAPGLRLTGTAARLLLQVRTGRAASSAPGAAPVLGYPFAALCHVSHLAVTARNCSGQALSSAAGANMKNPSKALLLYRERRLLLVSYASKTPFFSFPLRPTLLPLLLGRVFTP